MAINGKAAPLVPTLPNSKVRKPLFILKITEDGWVGRFENTRAELSLGGRRDSLYQIVERCRQRWPNLRLSFEETILEDVM